MNNIQPNASCKSDEKMNNIQPNASCKSDEKIKFKILTFHIKFLITSGKN